MEQRHQRRLAISISLAICAFVAGASTVGIWKGSEARGQGSRAMKDVRLMTLEPGHFHAALIQKEMYPGVSARVHVYAPLGFDLTEHLNRIARFNQRPEAPTQWELEVHAGPSSLARMLSEKPGNVVVLSGRNRGKIDRLKASVDAGLNVLADKPWIIDAADFPKLEATLDTAEKQKLIAYDIMTERSEITTVLQRELIHDPGVFGELSKGSEQEPAVFMDSVHYILKVVAGAPNIRPAWFFDVEQQGEGLADITTHLADLVQWMLFPDRPVNYRKDIDVVAAKRWPTMLTQEQFQRVTNEPKFPDYLSKNLRGGQLEYFCNGWVAYRIRGVHVKANVIWNYEPTTGGDTHFAVFRGSKSRVEIRQGKEESYRPELYVVPHGAADKPEIRAALEAKVTALQARFPGIAVAERGPELMVTIPDKYRVGHEAHFAEVTTRFLDYLGDTRRLPSWEKENMLAKYYLTTKAVEMSRR
ncbi:MAG: putative oxidoreductase C-terminal domain-containing protein [Acidobacteriota bacterium]